MVTISLCMIVRDEEDVLARCLDSVRAAVDEIIIVDTGSRDATREIARRYTERVFDFPWQDDFAAARNFSFAQAAMDYLLWLDADDMLPPASLQALLRLKQTLPPEAAVVMAPYHIAFDEQGAPRFVYERERLLKNNAGFRWQGAVHEAITPSGLVLHADAFVVEHRKLKSGDPDRNLRIFEKQLAAGAVLSPRERFYYARELYYHQRYAEAVAAFHEFLAMPGGWLENRLEAYQMIAACQERQGALDEALRTLLHSLAEAAPRAALCCEIGRCLFEKGNYPAAIFWYQTAASCEKTAHGGAFIDPDCYDYTPYLQLCVCYYRLGDVATARRYHALAAALKPDAAAVRYNEAFFASL